MKNWHSSVLQGWSALHYTAATGLWSLLNDMAMKEGVDLYSVTDNNELIEDCPEDRVDRTKCKGMQEDTLLPWQIFDWLDRV